MGTRELLVVAGEGSGDALAAPVLRRLRVPACGLGGALLREAGLAPVADLRDVAAMGIPAVAARAAAIARATLRLVRLVRAHRFSAALLVGFSELNLRLLPLLSHHGVRVLWYAPPQIWAWRARRGPAIARACEALALTLPFEVDAWRAAGARAEYVGHRALGLGAAPPLHVPTRSIALLPGSREAEVRRHLPLMLGVAGRMGLRATVVRARALDATTARWVSSLARTAGATVSDVEVSTALAGAQAAVAASGTATLECAALGVPPVIVYRTDPVTFAVARRWVRVPHIGLPNLVLGRRAFPELVQGEATVPDVAEALRQVLANRPALLDACGEVRATLARGLDGRPPDERVAERLAPWLD